MQDDNILGITGDDGSRLPTFRDTALFAFIDHTEM